MADVNREESDVTNGVTGDGRQWRSIDPPAQLGHIGAHRQEDDVTTFPLSTHADQHFHTNDPMVQVGWLGHADWRVYRLDENPAATEPGGFSPIYRHWGEKCGHQIQAEDAAADGR